MDRMSINTFPKASKHPVLRAYSIVFGLCILGLVVFYINKGVIPTKFGVISEEKDPYLFYFGLLMVSITGLYFIFPTTHRRIKNSVKRLYFCVYRKLTRH
jgi:hypothetical protein